MLAMLLIGPERLPGYVAQLRSWVKSAKRFADGAKDQLRDQMGPEFDDIDWKSYDPREYDPRKIVRDALADIDDDDDDERSQEERRPVRSVAYDPSRPTPFDNEAT